MYVWLKFPHRENDQVKCSLCYEMVELGGMLLIRSHVLSTIRIILSPFTKEYRVLYTRNGISKFFT